MLDGCEPLTILVIDDESLIRWALSEALSDAGHAVVEASDAAGGLRAVMAAEHPFDVIFLDFRLPDSDDFTLLTAIRTRAPGSAVVLMTASGTPEMFSEAYRLGVAQVLTKPFDLVDVHTVVAAVSVAARTFGGTGHGSSCHHCVSVSVPMDLNRLGTEARAVDLCGLPALP